MKNSVSTQKFGAFFVGLGGGMVLMGMLFKMSLTGEAVGALCGFAFVVLGYVLDR